MKKPIKPKKRIEFPVYKKFPFYNYNDDGNLTVSLSEFMKWMKDNIPAKAKNILLGLDDDSYNEYNDFSDNCTPVLRFSWTEMRLNPIYEKQLKTYERKLVKWEKMDKFRK